MPESTPQADETAPSAKRGNLPLVVAAVIVVLAVAAWLVVTHGNPQWHWRLYAFQAKNAPEQRLEPGSAFSGEWLNWDQEGRVVSRYHYSRGRRDGRYQVFTPDGGPLSEGMYKNGELDGLQLVHQEGGARTEITFSDGKRSGVEKTFYPNGQIAVEAPWEDGEQHGSVTFYYENGAVQSSIPFYRGKREGVHKTFFDTGAPQGDETYRDDMLNGPSEFRHPDGTPDMTLNYRDDKMDGIQTWYHPNGEKAREIHMTLGAPNGEWKEWDENGTLIVDDVYDMGELKRDKKPSDKKPEEEGGKK